MYVNAVSGSTEKVTLKTVTGQSVAEHQFDGTVCYNHKAPQADTGSK